MSKRHLQTGLGLALLFAAAGCQERGPGPTIKVAGTMIEGRGNHSAAEFVTGVVTLRDGDIITVHVLNFSDGEQPCDIEIYRDTRDGAQEVGKNDAYKIRSRGVASSRYSVKNAGEYWVLVKGRTSLLVPQATFASGKTAEGAAPLVVFKPGDFLKTEASRAPSYARGTEKAPTTEVRKETFKAEPKPTEKKEK
jgi:hypothetical protein